MVQLLGFQITRPKEEKDSKGSQAFTVPSLMTEQQLYLLAVISANTWIWMLPLKMKKD